LILGFICATSGQGMKRHRKSGNGWTITVNLLQALHYKSSVQQVMCNL
jgi:hypothetical protein